MAKVSVIMPAYNAEKYIAESVNSVLEQTYQDFELIIVDDCSGDRTYEMILDMQKKDSRIVVYKNPQNAGVAATRTFAISKAKGEWIAFLDSDDLWRNDKLEKQVGLIEGNKEIDISYTASAYINEEGKSFSYVLHAKEKVSYKELLKANIMSCSSVMVKKDIIQRIGMVRDDMHEDFTAWLLILREGRLAYGIDEPLLIYRLVGNSKSSNRVKSAKMIFNSYRYVGYNCLSATLYMLRYSIYSISKRRNIRKSGEV